MIKLLEKFNKDKPLEKQLWRATNKSETINQQITRQFQEGKSANALSELVGKWPGNESEEEFEQLLKEF